MTNFLDAINAAAARMKQETNTTPALPRDGVKAATVKPTGKPSDTKERKNTSRTTVPSSTRTTAKKSDTKKTKGGASYVIPAEFKQAIEDYLKGRADMADKLNKNGKSIDGCCDYIFDVMRKRAEKNRGGKTAVGLYASPDEIFGMAVHYYDESDEDLKKEK